MIKSSQTSITTSHIQQNNWEELVLSLSPHFISSCPNFVESLSELPIRVIVYLRDTVSKYPWVNQLTFAMIACDKNIDTPIYNLLINLHVFFRTAIPLIYPTIDVLDAEDAFVRLYNDYCIDLIQDVSYYTRIQKFVDIYLEDQEPAVRELLIPYQMPRLIITNRLTKLLADSKRKGRIEKEINTEPVKQKFAQLLNKSLARCSWIQRLYESVTNIQNDVNENKITLPVEIHMLRWDGNGDIGFRIWNRMTYTINHISKYRAVAGDKRSHLRICENSINKHGETIFLQLIGIIPDDSWFLKAIEVGALQSGSKSKRDEEYIEQNKLRRTLSSGSHPGILLPSQSMGEFLLSARRRASGNDDDSKIIFDLAPLVTAAVIGNLAIQTIGFTGIRMSELQQLSLDGECIKIEKIPILNPKTSEYEIDEYYTWNMYVKGRDTRVRVFVYRSIMGYVKQFMDFHRKFHNGKTQSAIHCVVGEGFTLSRLFPEPRRFIFQWQGKQIASQVINACIEFVLLEHSLTNINGETIRISSQLFRHGYAGYLHKQGISNEYISQLLHHIYIIVTEHYSKPTNEDIFQTITPLVNHLGAIMSIDKQSILSADDLNAFINEVMKKCGTLTKIIGGRCIGNCLCEVLSNCASCSEYRPDPSRYGELVDLVRFLKRRREQYKENKQYTELYKVNGLIRDWEIIIKEINSWSEILKLDYSNEDIKNVLPPIEFGAEESKLVFLELKRISDGLKRNGLE
jgi:hypothetical protein